MGLLFFYASFTTPIMKGGWINMILFTILLLILIFLVVFTVFAVSAGGAIFIIIFGDVIVCVFLIIWMLKHLMK